MIYVKRGQVPRSLAGPKSAGGMEKRAAIKAHANGEEFEFKAYKGADVVQALRELFHKKCAYCEFNYAAGGPEDIEHFRPKGAVVVNGKLSKPGYYWLAAEWSNLLPSCMDCNRKRTKRFANSESGMSGKANLFPVVNEKNRWRSHRKKNREEALLLNPCEDQPSKHLEFLKKGLVRAVSGKDGVPSPRGVESIRVYGLLRKDLVEQRAAKQMWVIAALELAFGLAASAKRTADAQARRDFERSASAQLKQARAHLNDNEPFHAAILAVFPEFGIKP